MEGGSEEDPTATAALLPRSMTKEKEEQEEVQEEENWNLKWHFPILRVHGVAVAGATNEKEEQEEIQEKENWNLKGNAEMKQDSDKEEPGIENDDVARRALGTSQFFESMTSLSQGVTKEKEEQEEFQEKENWNLKGDEEIKQDSDKEEPGIEYDDIARSALGTSELFECDELELNTMSFVETLLVRLTFPVGIFLISLRYWYRRHANPASNEAEQRYIPYLAERGYLTGALFPLFVNIATMLSLICPNCNQLPMSEVLLPTWLMIGVQLLPAATSSITSSGAEELRTWRRRLLHARITKALGWEDTLPFAQISLISSALQCVTDKTNLVTIGAIIGFVYSMTVRGFLLGVLFGFFAMLCMYALSFITLCASIKMFERRHADGVADEAALQQSLSLLDRWIWACATSLNVTSLEDKLLQGRAASQAFHFAYGLASALRCEEAARVLRVLHCSAQLVVHIPISSDFFRRWQRIHTLRVNLPVGRLVDSTLSIHDRSALTVDYEEALQHRLVSVAVMVEQFLVGVTSEKATRMNWMFVVLRLMHIMSAAAVVVIAAASPMILRGIPAGLGHIEFPQGDLVVQYMELVWILGVVLGLAMMISCLMSLSGLANKVSAAHLALNAMLTGLRASSDWSLPPVIVGDLATVVAWAEARGLFLASVHKEKTALELVLGYIVLSYVAVFVVWLTYFTQAQWHPGLLTVFSLCMMLLLVFVLPSVLVAGVQANRAMERQLGLLTSASLENATCRFYLDRRREQGARELELGQALVDGEISPRELAEAQEFTRALALNLQLDTNNMFGVLGLQLTIPKLLSLASASTSALVFLWARVGHRLADLSSFKFD